ncbi:MAG: HAMP domain-containing protein [Microthrixaceae bacterium]
MNTTLVGATSPATDLSADLVLDQTMSATGRQLAYATMLTQPGDIDAVVEGRFDAASARTDSLYLTYRTTLADAAERAIVDAARRDEAARQAGADMQALASGVSAEDLGTSPAEFAPAAVGTIGVYDQAKTDILQSSLQASSERVEVANRQVLVAIAIAAVAFIFTALIASIVVRSVIRPLRKLSDAAEGLATDTLPRLVDSLVNPAVEAPELTDLGVKGTDEIGQLAAAFNDVQQSIIDVSNRQSEVVTRGISDMYINLARRNQSLLDRQIQYIDSLESTEQDPDQLERLFRLDHLATRMRRNAESLLVLAGAEQGKRRTKAVPLSDVVRVAIGEVEDYQRLDILEIGDVNLRGDAAVDLAHLLSELMENGTQYSPPETTVDVVGHAAPDGAYAVVLTDRGMGMSEEQLAEANEHLAVAPALGLGAGRSLGFVVVAALAARHQISVRLSAAPTRAAAAVTLPQNLIDLIPAAAAAPSMYATAGALPALDQAPDQALGGEPGHRGPRHTGAISDAPTPSSWAEQAETSGVPAESHPTAPQEAVVGASTTRRRPSPKRPPPS